jgi:hypothetical protein
MAELGIAPHIVEAVLNHVSGHKAGVAGIYNRATYEREKRQALDLGLRTCLRSSRAAPATSCRCGPSVRALTEANIAHAPAPILTAEAALFLLLARLSMTVQGASVLSVGRGPMLLQ